MVTKSKYTERIMEEVETLSEESISQVIQFIDFLKWREARKEREIAEFDAWALNLAREKGFAHLTEEDVTRIVHEYRKTRR